MSFYIFDAVGSTFQGIEGWQAGQFFGTAANTNMVATVGNVTEVFDVGFYPDPDKTGLPPPFIAPFLGDALRDCRRYWQQFYSVFSGNVGASSPYNGTGPYPVAPRTTPTLTGSNYGATNFPAAAGTFSNVGNVTFWESRTANGTGVGAYQTLVTANARM